ncbi:MAG: hypothetical protein Kapaf2KO_07960 [Candidatus Kapaibacteriales bacterium]
MYKPLLLPLAKNDIDEAARWYNNQLSGLGKRFTGEVRSKVNMICENPRAYAIRYHNTRCTILKNFPFMIHYNLDEKNKKVIIAAFFHTSLSPEKWMKR